MFATSQQAVSAAASENSTPSIENFTKFKNLLQIRWKRGCILWTTFFNKLTWVRMESAEKTCWDLADFWFGNQKEK